MKRRLVAILIAGLTAFAGALAVAPSVSAQDEVEVTADEEAVIGGVVTEDGQPVDGVSIDLFAADPDGSRIEFLDSLQTGSAGPGRYEFAVEPGCYTVTALAPLDQNFTNGSVWINLSACVGAGESRTDLDAGIDPIGSARVSGRVVLSDNLDPINGIGVDLFRAGPDGSRAEYLRSTVSGQGGNPGFYSFDLNPECYVMTFYTDRTDVLFNFSSESWHDEFICFSAGEVYEDFDVFVDRLNDYSIVGQVLEGTFPVSDVSVDLFTADDSGARAGFVGTTVTNPDGNAQFLADPGCYVLTYIAPEGQTWEITGNAWLNQGVCVEAGMTTVVEPAVIAVPTFSVWVDVRVDRDRRPVDDVAFDVFRALPDGTRGEYIVSGQTGQPPIELRPGAGCWVVTVIAPSDNTFRSTGTGWYNAGFCEFSEGTSRISADLAIGPNVEVPLDLRNGPQDVAAEITPTIGIDYRIRAEPGSEFGLEITQLDGDCGDGSAMLRYELRNFEFTVDRGVISACDSFGRWSMGLRSELILDIRAFGENVQFEGSIAPVVNEDVPLDLPVEVPVTVSGRIETAFDGRDYVITAEPGQAVGLQLGGPTCGSAEDGLASLSVAALDSAERFLGVGGHPECLPSFMGAVPDDGVLKLRIFHTNEPLAGFVDRQSYELTAWLIDYETVEVPTDQQRYEFDGSIDVLFDATDYVFEVGSVVNIGTALLSPDCATGLGLDVTYFVDDRRARSRSGCDGFEPDFPVPHGTKVRVRVAGMFSADRPTTGPYRIRVDQRRVVPSCANGDRFERVFRDDFDGDSLADDWSLFDGVGNAGFGLVRPSAVTVVDGRLTITADMQDGTLISGGLTHDLSQTYGRYRFLLKTEGDRLQATSGEVLTWPTSGDGLRDGVNGMYSTGPAGREFIYSIFEPPFGAEREPTVFQDPVDHADRYQIMTMDWTPTEIQIRRDHPWNGDVGEPAFVWDASDDRVPDAPHQLQIHLAAWGDTVMHPVRMEIDWVEIYSYC